METIENTMQLIIEWITSIDFNWTALKSTIALLGDVCLFFIAAYTFRLTMFPKKLKFINFRQGMSTFDGDDFEITLENRSLCPTVIQSVDLVINSHRIKVSDKEYIVDGFKTAKIKMEHYSEIMSEDGSININVGDLPNVSLWVKTTRGAQQIKYERISRITFWFMCRKEKKFKQTTVCRNYYSGKLIVPGIRYALSFVDKNDDPHTVLIHKSGAMSEMLFGGNSIPDKIMQNKELLNRFFEEKFSAYGCRYNLQRIGAALTSQESSEEPD